jgi:hypothetical protein
MWRMWQEGTENASQYIKVDAFENKTVTLSKVIGYLLRDCVKLHKMAGLDNYCDWLAI